MPEIPADVVEAARATVHIGTSISDDDSVAIARALLTLHAAQQSPVYEVDTDKIDLTSFDLATRKNVTFVKQSPVQAAREAMRDAAVKLADEYEDGAASWEASEVYYEARKAYAALAAEAQWKDEKPLDYKSRIAKNGG